MKNHRRRRAWVLGSRDRWTLFFILAVLVFALSVDVQGFFAEGHPPPAPAGASVRAAWNAADPGAREFLANEHQAIVEEIRQRNEHEHLLFTLKFMLVGGTLYLLFQQARQSSSFQRTEFTSLVSWAAVVAASIVDLRVVANQTFIGTLGGWVRQYEQLRLGEGRAGLGWEAFLADHLLSQSYYPALRVSGQILTALLFLVTAGMFFRYPDRVTRGVSCAGALLSILLMTLAALSRRPNTSAMMLNTEIGIAAGLLVFVLGFSTKDPARKLRLSDGPPGGPGAAASGK